MSKRIEHKHRMCRIVGHPLCGLENCPSIKRPYPPGEHGTKRQNRRRSEYGTRLLEKQKLRFIYGLREKQFRRYYEKATRQKDITGTALLQLLETRLDNLVFRLGFARTIHAARQLVGHGHVLVNGRRVDIPSYSVRVGDVVSLSEAAIRFLGGKESLQGKLNVPPYLSADDNAIAGTLIRMPEREEIPVQIDDTMIVEYYAHY